MINVLWSTKCLILLSIPKALQSLDDKVVSWVFQDKWQSIWIHWKNWNFHVSYPSFCPFLVYFGHVYPLKSQFESEYALSTWLMLYFKFISNLVKFPGFSDLISWKNWNFRVSYPNFAHFWSILGVSTPWSPSLRVNMHYLHY